MKIIRGIWKMTDKCNSQSEVDEVSRRSFLQGAMIAAGGAVVFPLAYGQDKNNMNKYGLFGKLQAKNGKGAELDKILLKAAKLMENAKGCILYILSKEVDKPDAIWITEVWESKEDHDNSLNVPGVRELIMQAMPILEGKPEGGMTLEVLGGKGLKI